MIEGDFPARRIPVQLDVLDFDLPDEATAKTMMVSSYSTVNTRYLGIPFPNQGPQGEASKLIRDRHFQVARRHRISMIDSLASPDPTPANRPPPEWLPRLDGTLYTAQRGYRGPGEGVGSDVFVVGLYGTWSWRGQGEAAMHRNTDAWMQFFDANYPDTTVYLYLIDESPDYAQTERWAGFHASNNGIGRRMKSFATGGIAAADERVPSLDAIGSAFILASDRTSAPSTASSTTTASSSSTMATGPRAAPT